MVRGFKGRLALLVRIRQRPRETSVRLQCWFRFRLRKLSSPSFTVGVWLVCMPRVQGLVFRCEPPLSFGPTCFSGSRTGPRPLATGDGCAVHARGCGSVLCMSVRSLPPSQVVPRARFVVLDPAQPNAAVTCPRKEITFSRSIGLSYGGENVSLSENHGTRSPSLAKCLLVHREKA